MEHGRRFRYVASLFGDWMRSSGELQDRRNLERWHQP